jgi:hypothetical protein
MFDLILQMPQPEEDIEEPVTDWSLNQNGSEGDGLSLTGGTDGDGKDAGGTDGKDAGAVDAADGAKKVVIDLDAEEDGSKKKEMASRSEIWNHFEKIKENGLVVKGQCKYCQAEIKAHPVLNGTFGMCKHFSVCKRNHHKLMQHKVFCKSLKEIV